MKKHALLTTLLLISGTSVMNAASFANGSFELNTCAGGGSFTTLAGGSSCISGWTVDTNSIDYINSHWTAAEGNRSLDLNGNAGASSISQTFDTISGQSYQVWFAMAGNPDGLPIVKTLHVDVAGFSGDYSFSTAGKSRPDNMGWATETFNFSGTGASATLTFTSTTGGAFYGPALDAVSVSAVPEPGSIVMVSIAAALLTLGRRRLLRK